MKNRQGLKIRALSRIVFGNHITKNTDYFQCSPGFNMVRLPKPNSPFEYDDIPLRVYKYSSFKRIVSILIAYDETRDMVLYRMPIEAFYDRPWMPGAQP